jgi:hypothetical protein
MAAPNLRQSIEAPDEFSAVRTFLAERGIIPNASGEYDEQAISAIEAAIRSRGWIPTLHGTTGDWWIDIVDQRTPAQQPVAIAGGTTRVEALLRTLQIALTWMTSEEEASHYDDLAHEIVGMGAREFLERSDRGELTGDDPRVAYLLQRRPVSW